MSYPSITVGGLPGTGTSTLCRLLEQRTGLPCVSAGQIYRGEAAKRGVTLQSLNELCMEDPTIDRHLDDVQLEYLQRGGLILEGRLSGWIANRHGLATTKVWVTCSTEERIRRLVQRDGGDPTTQQELTDQRVKREIGRYRLHYGADLNDLGFYDLLLDSTDQPPHDLVDAVLASATRVRTD